MAEDKGTFQAFVDSICAECTKVEGCSKHESIEIMELGNGVSLKCVGGYTRIGKPVSEQVSA